MSFWIFIVLRYVRSNRLLLEEMKEFFGKIFFFLCYMVRTSSEHVLLCFLKVHLYGAFPFSLSFQTCFHELMFILQSCLPPLQTLSPSIFWRKLLASSHPIHNHCASRVCSYVNRLRAKNLQTQIEMDRFGGDQDDEDKDEFAWSTGGFSGREDKGKDYDKDLEFADIIRSYLDNLEKASSKVSFYFVPIKLLEERLRRKKNKILHSKTGSANPMQVKFNKFGFSNSYIWLEFYNTPLDEDISLIRDANPSWHIIGRLGGCNSMNMQVRLLQRHNSLYT
ncbi:uncharacterized protein [Primulina huaijiensis]|uniref:uncharacterized protein n=1 Tax=Primulina huaijiensis TaxID=1492673 RepID=UPI003CC6EFEF